MGAAVFGWCLSVGSAFLGVGGQYGSGPAALATPTFRWARTATNGRAHGCTTDFRLCSGRPSTGAQTRAGDRDLAVAMTQPQDRDGISRQEPA